MRLAEQPTECPVCGMEYRDLRTGLTFALVRSFMHVDDPDPAFWRQKRRRSVLGLWMEYKIGLWQIHLAECAYNERCGHEQPATTSGHIASYL